MCTVQIQIQATYSYSITLTMLQDIIKQLRVSIRHMSNDELKQHILNSEVFIHPLMRIGYCLYDMLQ